MPNIIFFSRDDIFCCTYFAVHNHGPKFVLKTLQWNSYYTNKSARTGLLQADHAI